MAKTNKVPSPGLSPSLVEALRQRAITYARQGNWKEALKINERIINNSKPYVDDFCRLGKSYLECNRLNEALSAYQKCLKINPAYPIALKNIRKIKNLLPVVPKPIPVITKPIESAIQPIQEETIEPQFEIGTRVRIKNRGSIGIITGIMPKGQYRIFIKQNEEPIIAEDDVEELVSSIGYVTPQEFLRDLLIFKMRRPLSDTLYSYSMSRTNFEAYQFKPAIKFLNNPYGKILIADEVGLGKTIEACIIYLELKARMRGDLPRVLVVCPSGLCTKWRSELSARFGEEFEIMDTALLRQYFNEFRDSGGTQRLRAICSIETLRREELTEQINNFGVDFDLVIIDEAHHMKNPEALSFDLGETLSAHTDHLIMLTATPVHLHSDDLFYLLNILEPGEFQHKEVFESQLEPNKILNRAIQELC
jgi:SNF2 family DNA or RNA helicase